MGKRFRNTPQLFEKVRIIDAGAEGMAIAKPEQKVVFIPFGAPGDIVDLQVIKRKKNFFEGKIVQFHSYSDERVSPACSHYGLCGGCKWQHLAYQHQLRYKQQQVKDHFDRIGKFPYPDIQPIIGSDQEYHYRNKLEFTFSSRKWLTDGKPSEELSSADLKGLGFHLPGMFDRILDIETCHLQDDLSNQIRRAIRQFAIENDYSFYNVKSHEGLMRNIILRNTKAGKWMLLLIISEEHEGVRNDLIPFLIKQFPQINSLFLVINSKKNDQIHDLPVELMHGLPYITESMASPVEGLQDLHFRIGPVSFYQTNAVQAEKLYKTAFKMADFTGNELVFDLYTGTGTIANYVARSVKKVVGIEYVEAAVRDAHINARLNEINNVDFIAGDMAAVFDQSFIEQHGQPDVVITDPPRAGMHPKVVERLIQLAAPKIVYVSCNPATQARDIAMMADHYTVEAVQPVDMFPQTHHVENVVLLSHRNKSSHRV